INATIPNWIALAGANFAIGGRTGGANDNHWIDDLCINSILPDSLGPVIFTPTQVVVSCTGVMTPVTFDVTAFDRCSGLRPVTTSPVSGSSFPIGKTTVTATSLDAIGNSSTKTFDVIVQDKPALLTIAHTGNNIVITYPQTCRSYVLEQSGTLPGTW